jgi:hypothetical protein
MECLRQGDLFYSTVFLPNFALEDVIKKAQKKCKELELYEH